VATDPERRQEEAVVSRDWFARGLGIAQLVISITVVVLGAYLVHRQQASERSATHREQLSDRAAIHREQAAERSGAASSEGRAVARAYAVQLGPVARGVKDMRFCNEKLLQFAEGEGTRVSFQDLKRLGAVLSTAQLTTVQQASNQLDRLYPRGYTAPPAGSLAAYHAWSDDGVLRARTKRADQLLAAALPALGGVPPRPARCNHL
jgi:hypothetical protein